MGVITERKRRNYSGLDADKALIPATSKFVNDTFFATDTKITYFWDGTAWTIIPLDVIVADMLKTDSVETLKIKDLNVTTGKAALGFGRYVGRDVTANDFTVANFPTTGAWVPDGLNLSAIVPAGAVAVMLSILIQGSVPTESFMLRSNATTRALNILRNDVQVDGVAHTIYGSILLDADRLLDYIRGANIGVIFLDVLGWWI